MIIISDELRDRYAMGAWMAGRGLLGEFAEIGVDTGEFAGNFLAGWPGARYHAVDHYEPYRDQPVERDMVERIAHGALARFADRVEWHRVDGCAWLRERPTGSLDGVYLDAGHEYWELVGELDQAVRAVRSGGVVAGHDFAPRHPEVVNAVRERGLVLGVDVFITTDPHQHWSWYFTRPRP